MAEWAAVRSWRMPTSLRSSRTSRWRPISHQLCQADNTVSHPTMVPTGDVTVTMMDDAGRTIVECHIDGRQALAAAAVDCRYRCITSASMGLVRRCLRTTSPTHRSSSTSACRRSAAYVAIHSRMAWHIWHNLHGSFCAWASLCARLGHCGPRCSL